MRRLAKYLGLVGLIVLSQSPAAADTQAISGELEANSTASAPPPETVAQTMAQDMLAKANACLSVIPRTRETTDCHRQCNYFSQVHHGLLTKLSIDNVYVLQDNCDTAYEAAGFNLATATPKPPTAEEGVAAMPAKQQYCSTKLAGLNCTQYDLRNPEHVCWHASLCAKLCTSTNEASKIETTRDPRKLRVGTRALSDCQDRYESTLKMLGE